MKQFRSARTVRRYLIVATLVFGLSLCTVYVVKQVQPNRVRLLSKSTLIYTPQPGDVLDPSYRWTDDSHLLMEYFVRNSQREEVLTILNLSDSTYNDLTGINNQRPEALGKQHLGGTHLLVSPNGKKLVYTYHFCELGEYQDTIVIADIPKDEISVWTRRPSTVRHPDFAWSKDSKQIIIISPKPAQPYDNYEYSTYSTDGDLISSFVKDGSGYAFNLCRDDMAGTRIEPRSGDWTPPPDEPNEIQGSMPSTSPDGKKVAWISINHPDNIRPLSILQQVTTPVIGRNRWEAVINVRDNKTKNEKRKIGTLWSEDMPFGCPTANA
ncbi:MAG: hypothetical protein ABJA67_08570 [Chthonomonadales bacterium]